MDKLRHLVTTWLSYGVLLSLQVSLPRPAQEGYEHAVLSRSPQSSQGLTLQPCVCFPLGMEGVEAPHLVRVPARLFILVKEMFLSKLPAVAIKHRTDPVGQEQG